MNTELGDIAKKLALHGFKSGAIRINPDKPFLWASGTWNPVYNDNRMFLFSPECRKLIIDGLALLVTESGKTFDVVAGTSTAGIPHGYGLAERLGLPFIYVRDKPKDHGMRNQIEGIDGEQDLGGKKVLLIEDLISTGGSSVKAVQAIRNAKGIIDECFSIFSYNLPKAVGMFAGTEIFDVKNEMKLETPCHFDSILNYKSLISLGILEGYLDASKQSILEEWMSDQEHWGAKHYQPKEN